MRVVPSVGGLGWARRWLRPPAGGGEWLLGSYNRSVAMSDFMLRIRRAIPEDAVAIAGLSRQLGYPSTAEETAARLDALSASALDAVFVATRETAARPAGVRSPAAPERVADRNAPAPASGARVIAWLHVFGRTMIESAPYAEIGGLVVDESERSRGVGRALVAEAESWAAARGYATIRVRSNVVREGAHRFYSARGYEASKRQTVFVKALR